MANNFIKSDLHPDGAPNTTLYPTTVPEQIIGLDDYISVHAPVGPAGPIGPIGPEGPQGPIGPRGDTGATGPIGPIGPQGEKGDQGLIGAVGPRGGTGPQGPRGLQGIEGPQGPRGVQGPAGRDGKSYEVQGQVDSIADLPIASTAYLGYAIYVGTEAPRDVFACVEYNGALVWENQGPLQGPVGPVGPEGPRGPEGPEGPQGVEGPQGEDGRAGNGVIGVTTIGYTAGTGQYEGYTQTNIELNTDEENMSFQCYARNGADGITPLTCKYVDPNSHNIGDTETFPPSDFNRKPVVGEYFNFYGVDSSNKIACIYTGKINSVIALGVNFEVTAKSSNFFGPQGDGLSVYNLNINCSQLSSDITVLYLTTSGYVSKTINAGSSVIISPIYGSPIWVTYTGTSVISVGMRSNAANMAICYNVNRDSVDGSKFWSLGITTSMQELANLSNTRSILIIPFIRKVSNNVIYFYTK